MDKQEEIWRPVKGYEGFYEVSNRGRVRSVDRWVIGKDGKRYFVKGQILKQYKNHNGYMRVKLYRNGERASTKQVHRLVAEAFIPNPENYPVVNHKDENPSNNQVTNQVSNLEWCSVRYNCNYGTANERRSRTMTNGVTSRPVLQLDPKTGSIVKEWPSLSEAERQMGYFSSSVSKCCQGKLNSAYRHVWRYKDEYDQNEPWVPVRVQNEILAINPKTGDVIHEFVSIAEAERHGYNERAVSACCNGKVLSHRGFVWRYKDDYDQESAWTPVKIGMESFAERLSKPVQAIDPKTGQVVKEFASATEAGRKGFNRTCISDCCLGKRKIHKGYCWRYKDGYDQESAWTPVKIGGEAIAASRSKAVQALDPKTGLVVKEFPSAAEAERKGFNSGHISACCRGERKTHKGLVWRYKPASNWSNAGGRQKP